MTIFVRVGVRVVAAARILLEDVVFIWTLIPYSLLSQHDTKGVRMCTSLVYHVLVQSSIASGGGRNKGVSLHIQPPGRPKDGKSDHLSFDIILSPYTISVTCFCLSLMPLTMALSLAACRLSHQVHCAQAEAWIPLARADLRMCCRSRCLGTPSVCHRVSTRGRTSSRPCARSASLSPTVMNPGIHCLPSVMTVRRASGSTGRSAATIPPGKKVGGHTACPPIEARVGMPFTEAAFSYLFMTIRSDVIRLCE